MRLCSVDTIGPTIFTSLQQEGVVSVFPTQTSLRYWQEEFVLQSPTQIVRNDALMAWDSFWHLFIPPSGLVSANDHIRMLFALQFLQSDPPLRYFCYPQPFSQQKNFASTIVEVLGRLTELESQKDELPADYAFDIQLIGKAYRDFLNQYSLDDPLLFLPSLNHYKGQQGVTYRIFFCQGCQRWEQFIQSVDLPPWIEAYGIQDEKQEALLHVFDNEKQELAAALEQISQLVKKGVNQREIILSVGNISSWRPYIEQMAEAEEIPLVIVQRRVLTDYTPGRYFQGLMELYSSNFSFEAMRSLLMDPRICWADKATQRALINRAVELSIIQGDRFTKHDQWIQKLGKKEKKEDGHLLQWYIQFKQAVVALLEASEAQPLIKAVYAIGNFALDEELWSEEQKDVHLYCMGQLYQFSQALQLTAYPAADPVYPLFVKQLARCRYIPQSKKRGISVYPYGTSIGMLVDYHFVVGCTLDASKVDENHRPLLPTAGALDQSPTERLLEHYRVGGKHVMFSHALKTFDGSGGLSPLWFIKLQKRLKEPKNIYSSTAKEMALWASGEPSAFEANWQMSHNVKRAEKTSFTTSALNLAFATAKTELMTYLVGPKGLIRLSPTAVDQFFNCPMQWAARYLFLAEDGPYDPQDLDHRHIGTLQHKILMLFFQKIKLFDQQKEQQYHLELDTIIQRISNEYAHSAVSPAPWAMSYSSRRYFEPLMQILSAEAKEFDTWTSINFELAAEVEEPNLSYSLNGRIDRVAQKNGQLALIDYKKQSAPSPSGFVPKEKKIASHQLPLYALLLPQRAQKAVYYSIDKGSYSIIWDENSLEMRDELIELAKEHLEQMVSQLQEGRIGATPSDQSCRYCNYRQICRRRYALL